MPDGNSLRNYSRENEILRAPRVSFSLQNCSENET